MDDSGPSNEVLEAFKKNLKGHTFDAEAFTRFICNHHNVSDPRFITPFGSRIPAWDLMRESHIKVELGSVLKEGMDPGDVSVFQCHLEDRNNAESQVFVCKLDPESSWCKFLDDPQPKKPFEHPNTRASMAGDLSKVCVYSTIVRHQLSSVPVSVAVRMNYNHKGLSELEGTDMQDLLFGESGGIRGAFMAVHPTTKDGEDVKRIPIYSLDYSYTHPEFVRTMSLVTEANLMNGIVEVPHNVCIEVGLPVFRGYPGPSPMDLAKFMGKLTLKEDAEKERTAFISSIKAANEETHRDDPKVDAFYAVPINHVLAWGLHSEDYMKANGGRAEQYRFLNPDTGEPILLYYLVADRYMDAMVEALKKTWMGKVDVRPLSDIAFEFLPMLHGEYPDIPEETTTVRGVLKIRAYLDYMTAPSDLSQATLNELAPALSPTFPSCHDWSIDEHVRQMAIERHMARELEAEKVRKKTSKKI